MPANPDFKDLFKLFDAAGVEYLVVGAHAVVYYTETIQSRSAAKAERVLRSLCISVTWPCRGESFRRSTA